MTQDIRSQIKQKKPFTCREEELYLNIIRTADQLQWKGMKLLAASNLSGTQYNVLRILRGSLETGLPCGEISERMLTRDSDITRLLDRMEKTGFVTRNRGTKDRRVVTARILPKGLEVLRQLDEPMLHLHRSQLGHLDPKQQESLIRLLELARDKLTEGDA